MYNVLLMRMKGDQILSVCLDITTHLCLHLAEGGAATEGKEETLYMEKQIKRLKGFFTKVSN